MNAQPDFAPLVGVGLFAAIFGVVLLISVLVTVLPFWKICSKAGFPGALSLLMLVPVANLILPFYIAFAEWPALRGVNRRF